MKALLILDIIFIVFIAGCTQSTLYMCPDGSNVNSPDLCQKPNFSADNIVLLSEGYLNPQFCVFITSADRYNDSKCYVQVMPTNGGAQTTWNWCKQSLMVDMKIINIDRPYATYYCSFMEGTNDLGTFRSGTTSDYTMRIDTVSPESSPTLLDIRDSHQITMCCIYEGEPKIPSGGTSSKLVTLNSTQACKQFTVDSCIKS